MKPTGQRSAGGGSTQYQILGHLATGGMAELFIARAVGKTGADGHVVLKRIMADYSRNHRFVTMFLDEARLAAQLHHPHVAQVHDIGRIGHSYFFTMEYVHGENVRNLLHRVAALKRQIPLEHVLTVITGAAAGLHYAHEKRGLDRRPLDIVHRDVSPSNLMVSFDGGVKLVDFGIAKAADRMTETRSGAVKGKVSYMSPEQCTGSLLDRRSDIFSLGVVLYEMATMTRLFKYGSDFETMNHIVNLPVPRPTRRRADLPGALEDVILKALARRPEDRYGSAGELQVALQQVAVADGLTLGAPSLARFVRELFGERPEPWHELEASADPSDVVTVDGPDHGDRPTERRRMSIAGRVLSDWQPDEAEDADEAVAPPPPPVPTARPPRGADAFDAATDVVPMDIAMAIPRIVPMGATADALRPAEPVLMALLPEPAWPTATDPSWSAEADPSWSAAAEPPPRRRWWLWTSIAAGTLGAALLVAAIVESDDHAGQMTAPERAIRVDRDAVVPSAVMAVPVTPVIDPDPVTAPVTVTPPVTPPTAEPPATASGPALIKRAQPTKPAPVRPTTTRTPKPAAAPAPAAVKCGDAMGIYPPCE